MCLSRGGQAEVGVNEYQDEFARSLAISCFILVDHDKKLSNTTRCGLFDSILNVTTGNVTF